MWKSIKNFCAEVKASVKAGKKYSDFKYGRKRREKADELFAFEKSKKEASE